MPEEPDQAAASGSDPKRFLAIQKNRAHYIRGKSMLRIHVNSIGTIQNHHARILANVHSAVPVGIEAGLRMRSGWDSLRTVHKVRLPMRKAV
jgi:hypothetical protein